MSTNLLKDVMTLITSNCFYITRHPAIYTKFYGAFNYYVTIKLPKFELSLPLCSQFSILVAPLPPENVQNLTSTLPSPPTAS